MTNLTSRVREQGVALMMTLGILSLILILAMSFAFTARTNRMLSQTNADMTRSRLLAKSALERVIADLGYTFHSSKYIKTGGPDDADDRSCIYPATSDAPFAVFGTGVLAEYGKQHVWISSKNDGDDVGAKEALTCLGGVPGSGRFPELGTLPSSAGWEHRKEYRKQPGTPVTFREELVGRISFAVIGESGKIDPGGVLTVNGEPYWGATPADGFYDLDLDTSPDAFNYTPASFTDWNETKIPRLGLSPQEIRLHSDYAEGFWKSLPPVGNKAADWFSWRHIAAGLTADGSTLLMTSATRAEMLEEYFPYSYDCESYMYLDYSVDNAVLEEKHRTDLWALPWETQDWLTDTDDLDWLGAYPLDDAGGVTGRGPDNFRDAATGNIQAANTDPANSTGGVPAFGQFTSEAVTRSTLINIIDNADPDNEASVLPAGSEWDIVNVGCEIQPYLNEIGIEVTYTWDDGADDTITTDDTGTVSITMCLELAEIYGIARPCNAKARISYEIEYLDSDDAEQTENETDKEVTFDLVTAKANEYTLTTATTFTDDDFFDTDPAPVKITFTITKLELNLKTDDDDDVGTPDVFADYALLVDEDDADSPDISAELDGEGTDPATRYIYLQTDDPRCNTLLSCWKPLGEASEGYMSEEIDVDGLFDTDHEATGDSGTKNDDVNPATGSEDITGYDPAAVPREFDLETVTDPVLGLSNAHIANTPNFTFWELGAVHRGEPWRTINLHAFEKLEEDGTSQFRTYAKGDAAILTQTKLGGFTETRGKVNANSAHAGTWYQLLNGISVGGNHAGTTAGVLLTDTEITDKADAIVAYNLGSNDRLLERGEIAGFAALTDGTTDREQEELIGKLANLLTVRQNLFSIMVTAQAVKDTGTIDAKLHNTFQYDGTNYCNILSEQRLLATVYRDAFTNLFRVVRVEYLED